MKTKFFEAWFNRPNELEIYLLDNGCEAGGEISGTPEEIAADLRKLVDQVEAWKQGK